MVMLMLVRFGQSSHAVADDDDDVVGGQLIVMSLSSVTAATAQ